jgi:predicted N-acetyltransferase YhbS
MLSTTVNRPLMPDDVPLISALHERVFGPGRFARTAYRIREAHTLAGGKASPFCRVAVAGGDLVAALHMTDVTIGGRGGALLLGPLVVAPEVAGKGFGRSLVTDSLEAARASGIRLVVLVGDEPYYGRFGFKPVPPGAITLPGPVNPLRLLAVELVPGALPDYRGLVTAAGAPAAE